MSLWMIDGRVVAGIDMQQVMCYRHEDRPAQTFSLGDAYGTRIYLCRECLTDFSEWLNAGKL